MCPADNSAPAASAGRSIAVIGGGISGLATAYRLLRREPAARIVVFESASRLGGVLHTQVRDGFLLERSADMFTSKLPQALALCRELGIDGELISTDAENRRAFIVHRGRLVEVPEGFALMQPNRIGSVLRTSLLSWRAKLRLFGERWVRPRNRPGEPLRDESLADFARRRLGVEVYERLVQPLIGGIYTADPEQLSMLATMPQFLEMERAFGSLTRAALAQKQDRSEQRASGARYDVFLAPKGGMQRIIEALAEALNPQRIRLNSPVSQLRRTSAGWELELPSGREAFDSVVVALPANRASRLLQTAAPQLAAALGEIPYAGVAIAVMAFAREQIRHPLDGFGFVVPTVERRRILAGSFSSVKFAGRAPAGYRLLRTFVGGALQPELAELDDAPLTQLVLEELDSLLGIQGQPQFTEIVRWQNAMPQYHLGHRERVARIEQLAGTLPRFQLAGNAYRGVGVPQCIASGDRAAEALLSRPDNSSAAPENAHD